MFAGILTHLRTTLPRTSTPAVELVEDIDELANYAGQVDSGAVVVVPWRESAAPQALATGGFRQRVAVQFLAGVVIRHYDALMGEARALQFDAHLRRLEAALAGWTPPGCIEGCQLVSGESSPIDTGVSIYIHAWETARFLTRP